MPPFKRKEGEDAISASKDWNPIIDFLNAIIAGEFLGLNATISNTKFSITNLFDRFPDDLRVCNITGVGTTNSGAGTYTAEEVYIDKTTVVDTWSLETRLGEHLMWDTSEIGNSSSFTDTIVVDDLFELNGTTGVEVGTIVLAMNLVQMENDVDSDTDRSQWVFAVSGGGGAYSGPYACQIDPADKNQIKVGFQRVAGDLEDRLQLGFNEIDRPIPEFIVPSFAEGTLFYEITTANAITLKDFNAMNPFYEPMPPQENGLLKYPLCSYKYDVGSLTVTLVNQLQFGLIRYESVTT